MKVYPQSGREWFAACLLPFKVFAPMGYLAIVLENCALGYRAGPGNLTSVVLNGYVLSFVALAIGGVIQHEIGPRKAYLSTCGFIIALLVFGWLILPYLAHT
jgi:hypothetical protein